MTKKGTRKSKRAKKTPPKALAKTKEETTPTIEPETGSEKPKEAEQPSAPPTPEVEMAIPVVQTPGMPTFRPEVPMVNLLASIRDVGRLKITVPAEKVDEVLEKIWQTGFKQKLANYQRTHQVYGPHMIDRIDVEPIP